MLTLIRGKLTDNYNRVVLENLAHLCEAESLST